MISNPLLLELNAFTWMSGLKARYGSKLTLATIPDSEWRAIRERGFDAVWLMGIWKRSPRARQMALNIPELKTEYNRILPGWIPEHVGGSAYAIYDYTPDAFLGSWKDLAKLKAAMNQAGLRLILDFVPNHLALDHRWTLRHPDRLVRPTPTARRKHPEWFFKPAQGVFLAHGRDPNFSPWSDTVQINAFSADARKAMRQVLENIAEVSDGVRCDMAMLEVSDIFKKTWGDCVSSPASAPKKEFWEDVLLPVKANFPEFKAIAECYWGMGQKLLSLGFDAVYDKMLYDRLLEGNVGKIRERLHDSQRDQETQLRFVENHDELRATAAFGREKALAAQAVTFTLPGLRLFHQDQERGLRDRVPVQLKTFFRGPTDEPFQDATRSLLEFARQPVFHGGRWRVIAPHEAWPGSADHRSILSWIWTRGRDFVLVAVNFAPDRGIARLRLPEDSLPAETVTFRDHADGALYERQAAEMTGEGLYVDLGPWKYHLLAPAKGSF